MKDGMAGYGRRGRRDDGRWRGKPRPQRTTERRAIRLLDERGEAGREYAVFSDAQAAIARMQHDRCGPAQVLAKAVISTTDDFYRRGNTLSLRWTPSHVGVEGNEQADRAAKRAAEGEGERAEPEYLREASLAHLMRKTTEERSEAAREWVRGHVGRRHRYRPPPGGKLRKGLARTREELAGRFYQLLSGHAATAEHLRRIGQSRTDRCWWCGSGER